MLRLALTAGEPAGIGPELLVRVAQLPWSAELVALADPAQLADLAARLHLPLQLHSYDPAEPRRHQPGALSVLPVPLAEPVRHGQLNPANAPAVMAMLTRAAEGAESGEFAAIVTAPVQKSVLNQGAVRFTGHTEFFAERVKRPVVMLLVADRLRVALQTTHLPLRAVADAIKPDELSNTLCILHRELRERFKIDTPRIAVLGLNPHAGESGHLGREEIEIIEPVLNAWRAEGMQLIGPLPADTAMVPSRLAAFDAVLAMYHDQGLPVLKYAGFGHAVNMTLGLPYIRTSVDHGTALDLAGQGVADPGSLIAATRLALDLISERQ
ncbi:4-hydroxythreonine-4-phosphate dehydrogenase PdxA [Ahniella affigens]|uniref:4-hydroxythreonine-4-phosphate dehydrogenase n=1 Tax=Ahniella affigens TaxID=2021234 RepID=A0A2P1PLK3_9GAMM|nr:4-hydroxythreonine-4-phosphate dehydrogenase PdxA [Ahniella affigens]AVP95712.1 4-hydroxythreonine-4-phosphate dehydrogenase PdxA [Ahniella affigens]